MSEKRHFDVLIVGGGIVGLTAALLCSQLSLRIAVFDRRCLVKKKLFSGNDADPKTYAINQSTQAVFRSIGLWEQVKQYISPFRRVQVYAGGEAGQIEFDSVEIRQPVLGYIIEHTAVEQALMTSAASHPAISFFSPISLRSIESNQEGVWAVTTGQECYTGKVLLGADGGCSWVRKQMGMAVLERDYQQQSMIATVQNTEPHHQVAYQQFMPKGVLALLPKCSPYQQSMIWSVDTEDVNQFEGLDDQAFLMQLNSKIVHKLGRVEQIIGERMVVPLWMRHAKSYVKGRVILLGDAAHTIHPLAGLGLNLGVADVQQLYMNFQEAIHRGRSIHDSNILKKYEVYRKAYNWKVMWFVSALKTIYCHPLPYYQWLGGMGFNVVNQSIKLKQFFIHHAVQSI